MANKTPLSIEELMSRVKNALSFVSKEEITRNLLDEGYDTHQVRYAVSAGEILFNDHLQSLES